MTKRSIHSKFMASSLATVLALPALAGALTFATPDIAEAADKATCRIHAIEAKEQGDGKIPAELDFMADELKAPAFRIYKGFKLLDVQDFKLEIGKVEDNKFKSGHNLELSLLSKRGGKLELHTKLMRSDAVLVDMDFGMQSNQFVLIPVTRDDTAVIFAYQCKG